MWFTVTAGYKLEFDKDKDIVEGWPGTDTFTAAQSAVLNADYDGIACSFSGMEIWVQLIADQGKWDTVKLTSVYEKHEAGEYYVTAEDMKQFFPEFNESEVLRMKLSDINIRDPYILPHKGIYYLYGTRSATCWGKAEGFDCYYSSDLEDWQGPVEIFRRPKEFPLDENYWAPECYYLDGRFYLLTTLGGEKVKKGLYFLVSDRPTGPFSLYSGRLTPEDWTCIDGSLYRKDGHTYLLFSHSFEDGTWDGDMCYLELSADCKEGIGKPELLFSAAQAPWPRPFPWAREEFGIEEDCYFTDGPFIIEEDGALRLFWSSWCTKGYAVGEAVSSSGSIRGPWEHRDRLIFPENGGHGMAFRRFDGRLLYTLHYPNDKYKEHPIFIEIT